MRAIKLCYEDRCVYGAELTDKRCEFLKKNMDSFMVMYRTQGSTFWLRFVLSFRSYIEDKFISAATNSRFLCYCIPFMKVLNYIFINIHKKLIEGSNTSVKKYINNLNIMGLNSPQYKKLEPRKWMTFLKESKHLYNTFNNILGLPDLTHINEQNEFVALVYTVYADYFSSLCSVFELWYFSCDLTEEEVKNIDTKVIYWLPNAVTKPYIKKTINYHSSCFEKYLAEYWKEDLQKMILTENIHHLFSSHDKHECCENFDYERNIFNMFGYPSHMVNALFKIWNDEILSDDEYSTDDDEEDVKTITEIKIKEVCFLHPKKEKCSKHKNCFIKIVHQASCLDPYVCNGSPECVFTCQINLEKETKSVNGTKFWEKMYVNVFPVDKTKQDVSTQAESCRNSIETYYQAPSSFLRHAYTQCITELYNFDFNPRKTECVKRLRKKLRDKQSKFLRLPVSREDFKEKFFRLNLMKYADAELMDIEFKYCVSKNEHSFPNGTVCTCFIKLINSTSNESTEVYGRVVNFEKTTFSVPVNAKTSGLANNKKNDLTKFFSAAGITPNSNPPKNNSKVNVTYNYEIGSKSDSKSNVSESKHFKSDLKNIANVESSSKSNSKSNSSLDSKSSSSLDSKSNSSLDSKSNSSLDSKSSSSLDSKSSTSLDSKSNSSSNSKTDISSDFNSSAILDFKINLTSNSMNSSAANSKNNLKIDEVIPKLDTKNAKVASLTSSCSTLFSENKFPSKDISKSENKAKPGIQKDIKIDSKSDSTTSFGINGIDVGKVPISNFSECCSKLSDSTLLANVGIIHDGSDELEPEKFDEFLKFIKIDKYKEDEHHTMSKNEINQETAIENFFNLIGLKDEAEASVDLKSGNEKSHKQGKLKICAYCQKKETEKKTFKRCSKCKEENFPVHRYYCSRECLIEDWNESHQAEHLQKQKHSP